jgi:hypothetical protein
LGESFAFVKGRFSMNECQGNSTLNNDLSTTDGYGRVNVVEILRTQYESGKMRPVETVPGMGERWIKKNDGGGEFNYDILQEFL